MVISTMSLIRQELMKEENALLASRVRFDFEIEEERTVRALRTRGPRADFLAAAGCSCIRVPGVPFVASS